MGQGAPGCGANVRFRVSEPAKENLGNATARTDEISGLAMRMLQKWVCLPVSANGKQD